jgi:hypothetical protein
LTAARRDPASGREKPASAQQRVGEHDGYGALAPSCAQNRRHLYGWIWSTPILGELFIATSTRAATTLMLGRENPRLSMA